MTVIMRFDRRIAPAPRVTLCLAAAVVLAGACRAAAADEFQARVDEALALPQASEQITRLQREAYRGNLRASYQLGVFAREGRVTPAGVEAAYDHFEAAAKPDWIRMRYKQGLPEAQYQLGVMHRDGVGAGRDAEEAAEWFERAAEQGHGPSQLALAELYLAGEGLEKDERLAYFWSSLAAREPALGESASAVRTLAASALTAEERRAVARRISRWTADTR